MRRAALFALLALAAGPAWAQRASAVFVSAPSSQVIAGDSAGLTAAAYDSAGNALTTAAIVWSVSDKTVLSIDPTGAVHAVGLGWSDVFADTTGARGTVRLQVVPLAINVHPANQTVHVGDTVQYSADVLDINSQLLQGVNLLWRAYGANSNQNNGIGIDPTGFATTYGYGTYFIEAYFNYTSGSGPFIPRFFGNTLLTVQPQASFTQSKLLDSTPVRQSFQLREHRGQLSVNDAGQIAYIGWLEGFATAALVWNQGVFTPVAMAGAPAELPGENLIDIGDLALNNNGEVSTRCITVPYKGCILFAGQDGVAHQIFFDGGSGPNSANIRNFVTTRFGLNDNSVTLFRADYLDIGGAVVKTGLFTITSSGSVSLAVAAATNLPGIGTTYTFDGDFGIANDGTILFFVTSGAQRALYRLTPDNAIARVVGTGDSINGAAVTSLGSVAVGKNGQYGVMANNGTQNLLLYAGDPAKRSLLAITNFNSIYAISSAGEAVFVASLPQGYGLQRWNGTTAQTVFLTGTPSPGGDLYTQFDSAGITAAGDVIAQARTANDLLLVVKSGSSSAKPSVVFQDGVQINAPAGPAFYNFVLNGHTGNPMIKTGWYTSDVFEASGGSLLPRLINGDRTPAGWFYEGNQDVRRNGDGDLFVSTDQSISRIGSSGASLLAHFPLRWNGGFLYTGFQVGANTAGTLVFVGGSSFGVQHLSTLTKGVPNVIAWLGSSAAYNTASPGGGTFSGSNDIGIADDGTVYASLRVNNGAAGLFAWTASGWQSILKVGDPYDGRVVTNIGTIRVAGTSCFALVQTTNGFSHISRYQNGAWTDVVSYGDAIPAGGLVTGIGAFDANRNGAVAADLFGGGGVQYLTYVNGTDIRVAADNSYPASTGEFLVSFFQVSLNDDGRLFATAINSVDQLVLYEFEPK